MRKVLEDVIEEHAEEAAFLWGQRDAAVRAPDYDLEELTELDDRVEAHLDGLRIAEDAGWHVCAEMGWELPGEYFTAMFLAIQARRDEYVNEVLDAAEGDEQATRGLISAFGWSVPSDLKAIVKRLLDDRSPQRRRVAIGACAVHRVDPRGQLERALVEQDDGLRARAAKAAGELGRIDCLPQLEAHLEAEDDELRFWAAWSASRLGSKVAPRILGLFAGSNNPRRRQAMNLALRLMEPIDSAQWVRSIGKDPAQRRFALIASGFQGDPVFLPGLANLFSDADHARVSGEAFEMITGLNIFRESLEVIPDQPAPTREEEPPDQTVQQLLSEESDDDDYEELGEDLGLVVPDPAKMNSWFELNRERFPRGTRHLCGQPITVENCLKIIQLGQQRQRIAAALELGLADPGKPLYEWRAPGYRQLEALRRLQHGE